ncbi:MAG: DNA-binding transcriptional regulator [Clostridia bacterium]|nr:DNA-binding transcriptional regulator [Clostridia bacterium]
MQDGFVQLMQALAPDLAREMTLRALVLERIAAMAPVGRRQLAAKMQLPEREIRTAANVLKEGGFISFDASGMTLTDRAQEIMPAVQAFTRVMHGLTELESQLSALLNTERVCIVGGDADADASVIGEVGRAAAQRVRSMLHAGSTLAVTGGSTMAATARAMQTSVPMRVMVVPARGGLGRAVGTQANTLAAEIAQRLGGHHRLIHLPDHMDDAAKQEMLRLPDVREVMELIQRADVILHGIGCAEENIRETKLSASQARKLLADGAAGEAFGSFFDRDGRCLLESSSIGVDLARLTPSCQMIAVAAGRHKAEAIISVLRHDRHALLVTDEGAAREMLRLLQST